MTKAICKICGKGFGAITPNHLKTHNLTMKEYRVMFPDAELSSTERNTKLSENNAMKNHKNREKVRLAMLGREVPWIKGKHLSDDHRRKIGDSHRGKVVSEETKMKMSQNKKRANKISIAKTGKSRPDMVGENNPMKLPEVRKKVSETKKKYYTEHPEAKLIGYKNPFYGKKHTDESKQKISKSHKGKAAWSKGLTKDTDERIMKMSKSLGGHIFTDETKQKMKDNHCNCSGKNHPNWQGGISFEPYSSEFNNTLKQQIRERDDYTCQLCWKKAKVVHHIDYNKKNSNVFNLITLCNSCNLKVNANRRAWTNFFSINLIQKT